MAYDVGDKIRVTCTFAVSGTNTDPTTVTLKTRSPSGTITTKTYAANPSEVVKSATGIFYYDLTFSSAGTWYVKFLGTGAVTAVEETSYIARASAIA